MNMTPEFVGTVHIFLGPYRGNPIALYLCKEGEICRISPQMYPWNRFIGTGETVNKAAANFEEEWKRGELTPETYSGPHWEGGIKPEKPKPAPRPPTPPKTEDAHNESTALKQSETADVTNAQKTSSDPTESTMESKVPLESQPTASPDNSSCLLYTSPSPRDLSTSRMPSSA